MPKIGGNRVRLGDIISESSRVRLSREMGPRHSIQPQRLLVQKYHKLSTNHWRQTCNADVYLSVSIKQIYSTLESLKIGITFNNCISKLSEKQNVQNVIAKSL